MIGLPEVKQGVESKVQLPFEQVKVTMLSKRGDPLVDGSAIFWQWNFEIEAPEVDKLLVKKVRFWRKVQDKMKVLLVLDYSAVGRVHHSEFWVGKEGKLENGRPAVGRLGDGRLATGDPKGIMVEITSFVRE